MLKDGYNHSIEKTKASRVRGLSLVGGFASDIYSQCASNDHIVHSFMVLKRVPHSYINALSTTPRYVTSTTVISKG
ncbi:hypothetical protein VCR29J2_700214 [Vibrio coralliirubri]|nr:hypothetical protein VCR29J2_700214 [Vibrio coralliirubri]